MKPEPLIQKLFAIERAIGKVRPAVLRTMIIDAQESALRLELDSLHSMDQVRQRLDQRRSAESGEQNWPPLQSNLPRSA